MRGFAQLNADVRAETQVKPWTTRCAAKGASDFGEPIAVGTHVCELVNEAAVLFDLENPDWSMLSGALSHACEAADIETIDDLSFESAELEIGDYKFPAYTAEVKPDDADTCHLVQHN